MSDLGNLVADANPEENIPPNLIPESIVQPLRGDRVLTSRYLRPLLLHRLTAKAYKRRISTHSVLCHPAAASC